MEFHGFLVQELHLLFLFQDACLVFEQPNGSCKSAACWCIVVCGFLGICLPFYWGVHAVLIMWQISFASAGSYRRSYPSNQSSCLHILNKVSSRLPSGWFILPICRFSGVWPLMYVSASWTHSEKLSIEWVPRGGQHLKEARQSIKSEALPQSSGIPYIVDNYRSFFHYYRTRSVAV